MRILSFTLALAFALASPSLAGSADGDLPGIGTFSYQGPGVGVSPASLMASR